MICASKSTVSLNYIKFLGPKVTRNLTNLPKKFCESQPCLFQKMFGKHAWPMVNSFSNHYNINIIASHGKS